MGFLGMVLSHLVIGFAMLVGLMLWHGALRDDTILNIALQAEAELAPVSGTE